MDALAPIIVGGHPALDLLNTVASPAGEPVDFLPDGAALMRWLVASQTLDAVEVRALERRFSEAQRDAAARQAVALREWLRPVVATSVAAGAVSLSAAERRHLNGILAAGPRIRELRREDGAYVVREAYRWRSAGQIIVPIADAIVAILVEEDFGRIRQCGGSACTLWFVDRSKSGRRQWCSMQLCGNRAKVAAHRRRTRRARRRGT